MPQVRRGQIGTNQAVVERERRAELISGGGKERKGKSWVLVLVRASHDAACARTRSSVTRHLHAEDEGDEGRACP